MTYERGKDKDLDEAVDKLRVYLPGFYPGCTIRIINGSGSWKAHIGKTFRSVEGAELIKYTAERFSQDTTVATSLDSFNTYSMNYTKEDLEVVDPIDWVAPDSRKEPVTPKSPNSLGYRIKTIDEMKAEFGYLSSVPGNFSDGMRHMAGMSITDEFASKVLEDRCGSSASNFINSVIGKDYHWAITSEMITNLPIGYTESKTVEVPEEEELLAFGKYKVGDVVVSLKNVGDSRKEGDMFTVLKDSDYHSLDYKKEYRSVSPKEWRAADEHETFFYRAGIKNISDIKTSVIPYHTSSLIPDGHYNHPSYLSRGYIGGWDPAIGHMSGSGTSDPDISEMFSKPKDELKLISDFTTTQLKSRNKRTKLSIN